MSESNEKVLNTAIAAHANWKHRLTNLVRTGQSDIDPRTAAKDDACEFGKWLKSYHPSPAERHVYQTVCSKHSEFHSAVGKVVSLVTAGNREEAERQIAFGSPYAAISAALTMEMQNWKKTGK